MLKKLLAGLTAVVLSLGMVALTAAPASAHHNTISASVACNTGPEGTWKVTWTITNSENITETITSSSDGSIVAVDTEIAAKDTLTVVRYYSSKPASNVTLTLSAEWTNGNTNTSSGKLYKDDFKDDCLPDETDKKVDICHANNGQGTGGFVFNNVSINSIIGPNGHAVHQNGRDIIPPFSYEKHGVVNSFPGLNWDASGQAVFNNGCSTKVTPAAPSFTNAVCNAQTTGSTPGGYLIPTTANVVYQVSLNGAGAVAATTGSFVATNPGDVVVVTATAAAGFTLKDYAGPWNHTFTNPGDCLDDSTPVAPDFAAAVCSTTTAGQFGTASYTIPTTAGVAYQVRINSGSWTDANPGTYPVAANATVRVRAVALDGYTLTGTTQWTEKFTAPDCITEVTSTKPAMTQAVCTAEEQVGPASFEIPAITGVKYQRVVGLSLVDLAPGTYPAVDGVPVLLRAVALPGYELANHDLFVNFKVYLLDFDNLKAGEDCIVPAVPTFDPQECVAYAPSQATFTIPSDTGVRYQQWNGTSWVTISAGTYDVDTFPETVTIRAVAKHGYHFLSGATTQWSEDFTSADDCVSDVTVEPATVVAQECVVDDDILRGGKFGAMVASLTGSYVDGWITIPSTANVDYFIAPDLVTPATAGNHSLPPGTYTVSAVAHTGYRLTGDVGPWVLEIKAAPPCGQLPDHPVVSPVVTFVQTTCSAAGSYTLAVEPAEEATGVIWTVSGGLPNTLGTHAVNTTGIVMVTAVPADGYGFPNIQGDDPKMEWTYTFTDLPDDCLPTLAFTGGGITLGALGLSAVLTLGGILLFTARRRDDALGTQG